MIVIGIDPGVHACGVGIVRVPEKQLISASLVRLPEREANRPDILGRLVEQYVSRAGQCLKIDHVVIEYPRSYMSAGQQKGDQNDLIRLALVAGACGAALYRASFPHDVRYTLPRDWKGTADPDMFTARIDGRLSPAERATILPCPASLLHNVLDGIGLALWSVGRMDRIRNYD